ncbi:MAG: hypothetical protein ACOCYW_07660 [Roseicyclus sp.]
MRILPALLLCLLPSQSPAWEAGVEGRLCTLDHAGETAEVRLTYDSAGPEYTISISRAEPWPEAPVFAMEFVGLQARRIATTRHVLSQDRLTLTVIDRGFGNVLDGLAFNSQALAESGEASVLIDLTGAAPEVAAFRACGTTPAV